PINNLITRELTSAFVKRLKDWNIVGVKYELENTNVNANGYDVVIDQQYIKNNTEIKGIVAEIKGNIPCGIGQYGAQQKAGIEKDLKGLQERKAKAGDLPIEEYVKFMVMLDSQDRKSKEAMEKLTQGKENIQFVEKAEDIRWEKSWINVLLLGLDKRES
ncbi:MAG: hypothetical protein ACOYJY_02895, partial [Acutalibacteraceae bacterium]